MNQDELVKAVARKKAEVAAAQQAEEQAKQQFTIDQFKSVADAMAKATDVLIAFLKNYEPKVKGFPTKIGTPDADKVVKAVKGLEKSLKPEKYDNKAVVEAVNKLTTCMETIHEKMPVTEAVEVTNIAEMTRTLADGQKQLTEALNKLELSPKITVPKPTVTVQPTDVKSVVAGLTKVEKAIEDNAASGGGGSAGAQDPLQRFTPVNMDDSTTVQYYSYIATDGEFYIRKVDKSGAFTTIRFYFGKGAAAHDTAWTGRAALTYTMWAT